jgi:hypothetical protein
MDNIIVILQLNALELFVKKQVQQEEHLHSYMEVMVYFLSDIMEK